MDKVKFKRYYLIIFSQLVLQILFFILGINFNSPESNIHTSFLEILTKVQINNVWQDFIWCLTNNIAVVFIVFWLNYWTWGIVGTLWGINNSFILGAVFRFCFILNSWLSVCFVMLEFIALVYSSLGGSYFRFKKDGFKKSLNLFHITDEKYSAIKTRQEKNIVINFLAIFIILFVAAVLESIVLNSF